MRVAVKSTLPWPGPPVKGALGGEKVYSASEGVTVYVPAASPVIWYVPSAPVTALAVPAVTVTPGRPCGPTRTVPEIENVGGGGPGAPILTTKASNPP